MNHRCLTAQHTELSVQGGRDEFAERRHFRSILLHAMIVYIIDSLVLLNSVLNFSMKYYYSFGDGASVPTPITSNCISNTESNPNISPGRSIWAPPTCICRQAPAAC